jgi:hypothetical protein
MDISGQLRPLSSFNYVAATCTMMSIFAKIERELAPQQAVRERLRDGCAVGAEQEDCAGAPGHDRGG